MYTVRAIEERKSSAAVQPDTIDKPGLPIGVKILPEPDRLWGVLLVLVFNFICVCQNVAYGGAGEEILADSVLRCLVSTLRSVPPSASLSVPRNPMFLPLRFPAGTELRIGSNSGPVGRGHSSAYTIAFAGWCCTLRASQRVVKPEPDTD